MEVNHVMHPFEPFYDVESEILILGSFPSVKSREQGFYYGHPSNRFWSMLAGVFEEEKPVSIEEKKAFLKKHHIALYDVIEECDIRGSADSSISSVIPTDICSILEKCPIRIILCNGKTSGSLYEKYQREMTGREAVTLPSTSSANAAVSLSELIREYGNRMRR